ncbi:basic proline-rich protein-like [Harpia harpyja]|uniref:basic proline-rich protein-like n=1 Tax=Harpia harpyja TaxID=202280 RepID=UPI0022B18322|nr:basic proline-rich protein-like [Harpia harpyja]
MNGGFVVMRQQRSVKRLGDLGWRGFYAEHHIWCSRRGALRPAVSPPPPPATTRGRHRAGQVRGRPAASTPPPRPPGGAAAAGPAGEAQRRRERGRGRERGRREAGSRLPGLWPAGALPGPSPGAQGPCWGCFPATAAPVAAAAASPRPCFELGRGCRCTRVSRLPGAPPGRLRPRLSRCRRGAAAAGGREPAAKPSPGRPGRPRGPRTGPGEGSGGNRGKTGEQCGNPRPFPPFSPRSLAPLREPGHRPLPVRRCPEFGAVPCLRAAAGVSVRALPLPPDSAVLPRPLPGLDPPALGWGLLPGPTGDRGQAPRWLLPAGFPGRRATGAAVAALPALPALAAAGERFAFLPPAPVRDPPRVPGWGPVTFPAALGTDSLGSPLGGSSCSSAFGAGGPRQLRVSTTGSAPARSRQRLPVLAPSRVPWTLSQSLSSAWCTPASQALGTNATGYPTSSGGPGTLPSPQRPPSPLHQQPTWPLGATPETAEAVSVPEPEHAGLAPRTLRANPGCRWGHRSGRSLRPARAAPGERDGGRPSVRRQRGEHPPTPQPSGAHGARGAARYRDPPGGGRRPEARPPSAPR